MAYTAPTTRSTSDLITASIWNTDLVNNISYLANPPTCRVYHNANVSIADSVYAAVAFNSERHKTIAGMHSTVTNNTRITLTDAGVYVVTFCVGYAAAADYISGRASIRLNGTTEIAEQWAGTQTDANDNYYVSVTTIYKFAANDYIEAMAWQNNSANAARNIMSTGNKTPEFAVMWTGLG